MKHLNNRSRFGYKVNFGISLYLLIFMFNNDTKKWKYVNFD